MTPERKVADLGTMLKTKLKDSSISMRKLSKLTNIDTSTISRIVNGKQKPRPEHLQQFSHHLNIPLEQLFEATGWELGKPEEKRAGIHSSIDTIQEVLVTSNFFDYHFTTEQVQKELAKHEKYALTEEGHQAIIKGFPIKLEQVSGAGPFIEQLKEMYEEYCQENVPATRRALLGSALLYFVHSVDIIPDYIFPIGYLDDAIAVQLVMKRLADEADQ